MISTAVRLARLACFATLLVLASEFVLADSWQPSHSCYEPTKPTKPFSLDNEWEIERYNRAIDQYNNEVEEFRDCIQSFVDEQNEAIRRHRSAADDAILDWNNFVNWN